MNPTYPHDGEPAILLATGQVLISHTERVLSPVPKLSKLAPRAITQMDTWVLAEARAEAAVRLDSFNATLFASMDVKRLSPADRSILSLYLFGNSNGACEANLAHEPSQGARP
jgi:hypothetical protein